MTTLPLAFFAGILTILAPCILPLLPVIVGGSLADKNPLRPLVLTLSLAVSIVLFSLLIKASTLLIEVPADFWKLLSGGIILFFAFTYIFPELWETCSLKCGLGNKSQELLNKAGQKKSWTGTILLGAALGPAFSSCSPVYFVILATILPVSFFWGVINLVAYSLGLALMMGLIAFFGQKLVIRLKVAADPKGWFKKVLGVLFLIVGLGIILGWDKKAEIWLLDHDLVPALEWEQQLLE